MAGENRYAFTTHADSAFDVCFENILTSRTLLIPYLPSGFLTRDVGGSIASPSKDVELDIDIGADAKDWSAIQAEQKLKPVEAELRRIEEVSGQVVSEMDYLREREIGLRDTNESTNERVKWFALGTMGLLVGLGVWQVVYLRAYFRFVVVVEVAFGQHSTDEELGPSILSRVHLTNQGKRALRNHYPLHTTRHVSLYQLRRSKTALHIAQVPSKTGRAAVTRQSLTTMKSIGAVAAYHKDQKQARRRLMSH